MLKHETLRQLEEESRASFAPCGAGQMIFRTWQPYANQDGYDPLGGELVVLLHGGAGSWMHWAKNLDVLSNYYEVLVPDLPGLGESASIDRDADPYFVADIVSKALTSLIGPRRFHLIGFSWGSVVSALVASHLGEQVKSIMVIGPASTGRLPGQPRLKSLVARSSSMSEDEISQVNTENLARLMFHDRQKIDSMALELHNANTKAARYNSPKFARGDYLLRGLEKTEAKLLVIYGDQDAVSVPYIDIRKQLLMSARSDLQFELVEQIGHWVQYEAPNWFNQRAVAWVEENTFE